VYPKPAAITIVEPPQKPVAVDFNGGKKPPPENSIPNSPLESNSKKMKPNGYEKKSFGCNRRSKS
jgi:hypothetical protein